MGDHDNEDEDKHDVPKAVKRTLHLGVVFVISKSIRPAKKGEISS